MDLFKHLANLLRAFKDLHRSKSMSSKKKEEKPTATVDQTLKLYDHNVGVKVIANTGYTNRAGEHVIIPIETKVDLKLSYLEMSETILDQRIKEAYDDAMDLHADKVDEKKRKYTDKKMSKEQSLSTIYFYGKKFIEATKKAVHFAARLHAISGEEKYLERALEYYDDINTEDGYFDTGVNIFRDKHDERDFAYGICNDIASNGIMPDEKWINVLLAVLKKHDIGLYGQKDKGFVVKYISDLVRCAKEADK